MKRILLCINILVLAVVLVACNNEEDISTNKDLSLWSKPSTQKVYQDIIYDEDFKLPLSVNIKAAKNEFEATQIIISPNYDVDQYDLILNDLRDDKGNVLSKNQFDLYNQKYIEVKRASPNFSNTLGWHPDALLPFDTAKAYGENFVQKNLNQSIYVEVYIPKNQTAGTYTGTFQLIVDDKTFDVPVEVLVWDFVVSDVTHLKSIFIIQYFNMVRGELDGTEEMYQKYVDKMVEFRIAPHRLTIEGVADHQMGVEKTVEVVRHYLNREVDRPSYLPAISLNAQPVSNNTNINEANFTDYVLALAQASLEDGFNYLDLAVVYMGFIDEPHFNGTYGNVNAVSKNFIRIKNEIANRFETEFDVEVGQEALKNQIKDSIINIKNYITAPDDEKFTDDVTHFSVGTSRVGSMELIDHYRDLDPEQWWYTAGSNKPGFRIDSDVLEQRLFNWMSFEYDFTGDLYWEVAQYHKSEWNVVTRRGDAIPIDPYEEAFRAQTGNGDGFLFYPGKPYDIEGPVTSVRLHQFRDSREEYEYLYYLEQMYEAEGLDVNVITQKLLSRLFSILNVTNSDELFAQSRETLAELILLAQEGIFITDYYQLGDEAYVSVLNKSETLEITHIQGESVENLAKYSITVKLEFEDNKFSFQTNTKLSLTWHLGPKAQVLFDFNVSVDDITVLSGGEVTKYTDEDIQAAQVIFDEKNDEGYYVFSVPTNKDQVNADSESIYTRVFNSSENKQYIRVYFEGQNGRETQVTDFVLLPGWNTLDIHQLNEVRWHLIGNVVHIKFEVFSKLDDQVEYIVIDDITVFN